MDRNNKGDNYNRPGGHWNHHGQGRGYHHGQGLGNHQNNYRNNSHNYYRNNDETPFSLGVDKSNSNSTRTFQIESNKDREERKKRLKGVNKETWNNFTLEDKIESQLSGDIEHYYHKSFIQEDTVEWAAEKESAAEYAVEELMNRMIKECPDENLSSYESDSDYSEPLYGGTTMSGPDLPYTKSIIENFINGLRYNLVFSVGFDVVFGNHPDDEKSCLCPCCKNMVKWRDNFHLNYMIEKDKCDYHRNSRPKGLMDHLKKIGDSGGYLHLGIELYLRKLYGNLYGNIGHRALYNAGDPDYNRAEAAARSKILGQMRALQNERDEAIKKNKEQQKILEAEEKIKKRLEETNQSLGEKYITMMKNFKQLNCEKPKKVVIDDKTMEVYRKLTRTVFDTIKDINIYRDPNYKKGKEKWDRVQINVPNRFILQNFFEKNQHEKNPQDATFLFRDIYDEIDVDDEDKKNNIHLPKLFTDWDIHYAAPKLGENGKRITGIKKKDRMEGIDQGGPTSQFITEFCMQLGDLSVVIPIDSEIKKGSRTKNDSELNKCKNGEDFIVPAEGWKVEYLGRTATISKFEYNRADLFDDVGNLMKEGVFRADFEVKAIAIKLFDKQASGLVPQTNDYLEQEFENAKRFVCFNQSDDEYYATVKKYYRAVGRFLLHVISDGRNPIPSTVMPEFFQNDCQPGSAEYPNGLVLLHISKLDIGAKKFSERNSKLPSKEAREKLFDGHDYDLDGVNDHGVVDELVKPKFSGFIDCEALIGADFESVGIEKKGQITVDNFFGDFICGLIIDRREMSLDALREGLTLGGAFPIQNIFRTQPLECVTKQLFAPATIDLEDIVRLLKPYYEDEEDPDKVSFENHEMFVKETVPKALATLHERNSSFLVDFVFFVSGSRCIPYSSGNPNFDLRITFEKSKGPDALPSAHTCVNLLAVPWCVYDNNMERFMEKLSNAVSYGLDAVFDQA